MRSEAKQWAGNGIQLLPGGDGEQRRNFKPGKVMGSHLFEKGICSSVNKGRKGHETRSRQTNYQEAMTVNRKRERLSTMVESRFKTHLGSKNNRTY